MQDFWSKDGANAGSSIKLMYNAISVKNPNKELNEDCILINKEVLPLDNIVLYSGHSDVNQLQVFAVCDGVSFGGNGRKSATLVSEMLKSSYEYLQDSLQKANAADFVVIIKRLIKEISGKLRNEFNDGESLGTTLALAMIYGRNAYIANVGDSRVYTLQDELLVQITKDHTIENLKRRKGFLISDAYIVSEDMQTLYQYMGQSGEIEPFVSGPFQINRNDRFLICTDGLFKALSRSCMLEVMRSESVDPLRDLIVKASKSEVTDDMTGIYIIVN